MNKVLSGTVAVSAVLLLALTGCNDKESTAGSAAGVQSKTDQAPPVEPKIALASAVKKINGQLTARVKGTVTAAGDTTTMSGVMKFSAPPVAKLEFTMAAKGKAEKGTMLMTPEALYVGQAGMAKDLGGKSWIRMGYADMARMASKASPGMADAFTQQLQEDQDPRAYMKMMIQSQNLRTVGTEDVGGESTTHYRGAIDVNKQLADTKLKGLTAAERAKLKKQLARFKLNKMDADVWVNKDGLPRRVAVKGGTGATTLDMTEELSDYGVPVSVTPPPASQVQDFGALMRQLQQQLGQAQKGLGSS